MNGYQIMRLRHRAQGSRSPRPNGINALPEGKWRWYAGGNACPCCGVNTTQVYRRWHYETDATGKSNEYDERFIVGIYWANCHQCDRVTWWRRRFDTSRWKLTEDLIRPYETIVEADMIVWGEPLYDEPLGLCWWQKAELKSITNAG